MEKRNIMLILVVSGAISGGVFLGFYSKNNHNDQIESPTAQNIPEQILKTKEETPQKKSIFAQREIINILLLGVDRRSKAENSFNTDTMILLSANPKNNVILLTSVPRDLWINGNKINALYTLYGEETLIDAFEKVTGLEIDGYIRADFEDFRWIVDSFGGVPVNVERSFTDVHFPNNTDTGLKPVSFEAGTEVMDGWRALDFSRSRKGTNGEGSDLMRAKRQHRVLMGMVDAISQPESIFWPIDLPKFYNAVTNHMHTTLSLNDIYYLWDYYKDRKDYTIKSFVVDDKYVYHPGMYPQSNYHAWVFIPREPGFETLHADIQNMLFPQPEEATIPEEQTPE